MKRLIPISFAFGAFILTACAEDTAATAAAPATAVAAPAITKAAVVADMRRIADWQLEHPSKHSEGDWTQAPFWSGLLALSRTSGDAKYFDAVYAMGERNKWKFNKRLYHADDHAVGKAYAEIYAVKKDPKIIADMIRVFDTIIAKPAADPDVLDFTTKRVLDKWSWCDALYMAPPAWTALSAATGEKKYLAFSDREYLRTQKYLYDAKQHLFYRDSTYFAKKEANGASVFWGRGNGWVIAGLADLLKVLPKDASSRANYETLVRDMSEKLVACQQADGSWHASLLDPVSYPKPEMSATALIAYGVAYGVNAGILDRAKYEPALDKAWAAIASHILEDGKLGSIQPIGAAPQKIKPTDTEVYGVGAALQFGEEYVRLIGSRK